MENSVNSAALVDGLFKDFSGETGLGLSILVVNQMAGGDNDDLTEKARGILGIWRKGMHKIIVASHADSDEARLFMDEVDNHIEEVIHGWRALWGMEPELKLV
jgi:hypothetical protein